MAQIPVSITEQIDTAKKLEISYRTLHTVADIHNISTNIKITIPYMSILSKYRYFLTNIIIPFQLDDALARQYLYKPKLFSYDIYGTTELWFELLHLNNWTSVIDFKPNRIKVYEPDGLKQVINEIMILENRLK